MASSRGFASGRVFCRLNRAQYFAGRNGNRRAGAKNSRCAVFVKLRIILRRNHATDEHHNVVRALRLQRLDEFGHQRFVASRQGGNANGMDVIFNRLARCLRRRLEERADIHVKA